MLGNVHMRNTRGREGHLSYQKAFRLLGSIPPIEATGIGPTIERHEITVCCCRECPFGSGWDKGNDGDKVLEHSIQETRIALVITPAPHHVNALCREKKNYLV